jgi:hypothetical protein
VKLASPFADKPAPEQPAEELPAEQPAPEQPAPARRTLLERFEAGFPGVLSAQLPPVNLVRAYYKAEPYVLWEAEVLRKSLTVYGWCAAAWTAGWSLAAWVGTGRWVPGLRGMWDDGPTSVFASQLPPLRDLHPMAALWVALWSLVAWCGIKPGRLFGALVFAALIFTPILLSL